MDCKYSTYLYDMAVYIRKYHFHPGIFPVHCIIKVFTEFFQTFDSYFTIAMFEKVKCVRCLIPGDCSMAFWFSHVVTSYLLTSL